MIVKSAQGSFLWFALLPLLAFSACSFPPRALVSRPASATSAKSDGFTNFETEPVRLLALSPDGKFLYAVNTADDRLKIFNAEGCTLRSVGETTVGLWPVGFALRRNEAVTVPELGLDHFLSRPPR